ncbi:MAG: dephospho-CoA kinase [Gudongella sp.]|nr:dephospho-CoA kinase [Gudongella sp.]
MKQNKVKVIGITGGIATGKTTVSKIIVEEGFQVIDSDSIAREVVQKGSEGLKLVIDQFGRDLLRDDGSLDREKLGDLIFQNDEKRKMLNDLLHPLIRESMTLRIDRTSYNNNVVFVDIPLLFESRGEIEDSGIILDEIWVVYTEEAIQLKRLMKRNDYTHDEALSRIRSQLDIEEKRKLADRVIDNSGSMEDTRKQVMKLLDEYR